MGLWPRFSVSRLCVCGCRRWRDSEEKPRKTIRKEADPCATFLLKAKPLMFLQVSPSASCPIHSPRPGPPSAPISTQRTLGTGLAMGKSSPGFESLYPVGLL